MRVPKVRRMTIAAVALSTLGLAASAQAASMGSVVHVLTVAGAPNSVASWRVVTPLTLGVSLFEPEQRLVGGDGEFAAIVVRDARHQLVWAEMAGNVPGRRSMVRVPVGGEPTLHPGSYSVELLSRRAQSLKLRVPGLGRDTALQTRSRTSDHMVVLTFGSLPATGIWVNPLTIHPSTVFLTQINGSSGLGSGPSNGTSLCALPPSMNLCAQPDELGSEHDQDIACVVVTCLIPTSYSQFTFRTYFGKTIPGLSVLSQQDEDGINPSWHAVVAISSNESTPVGHPPH